MREGDTVVGNFHIRAIERRQMPPQPFEIDEPVDGAQHVVSGNMIVQTKQTLLHQQSIAHH
jgi:hypothetical protein